MNKKTLRTLIMGALVAAAALVTVGVVSAQDSGRSTYKVKIKKIGDATPEKKVDKEERIAPLDEPSGKGTGFARPVNAKPLSDTVTKGLDWLVATQNADGGWGQGDESVNMRGGRRGGAQPMKSSSNVADTCMATLALMRSGSMPDSGKYKGTVRKGIEYVLGQIEESDRDSLYVTNVRGTRVQSKIGTYVDTFTAVMLLSEAKGHMGSAKGDKRLAKGLEKVIRKIEKNQQGDGTFANQGWAPTLTQGLATKGLNRAWQAGAEVDDDTLRRLEKAATAQSNAAPGAGDAGIALYGKASGSAGLRDTVNSYRTKNKELRKRAKKGDKKAAEELEANLKAADNADRAEADLVRNLDSPAFVQGFGNNGGEEFLSYMMVSESLLVTGGERWKKWDKQMNLMLTRVQNGDGSWTGHHCITGRTFCTATALMVLMADRAPVPVGTKLGRG